MRVEEGSWTTKVVNLKSFSCRKRLSCSESLYSEGDASPPLGARRRFSALMDTHRFAAPLEGEPDFLFRQSPVKVRGTSLDSTTVPSPSFLEQRASLKEVNGAGVEQVNERLTERCKLYHFI